jgi:hypothetical protein
LYLQCCSCFFMWTGITPEMMADKVHPNCERNIVLADLVFEVLRPNLEAKGFIFQ